MLNQTRGTKADLINAGIPKKDLSVLTPFDFKHKGYGAAQVIIYNSANYVRFKVIRKLLKLGYGVVVSIKENKPCHLSVFADYSIKGLNVFDLNKNEYLYTNKSIRP